MLLQKKQHPRETYDQIIKRIIENEEIPSMEEMFRRCDQIKDQKHYTTQQIVDMCHGMRRER
ncbi:hypothetical protein HYU06_02490 [Candidatus Woesearchaeota archaeon]|nr:hypothetical protein [Candidatus Woesearchaeota archaeon]